MLYESFWSALSRKWNNPFLATIALFHGKAAMKDFLYSVSDIDISTLPYDHKVISLIKEHKSLGGKVVLATASNKYFANKIAKHLKLFDEVYGSDKVNNLKGKHKADFLENKFGSNSFSYIGDSYADLPVWQISKNILTVNASSFLRKKVESLDKPTKHIVTKKKSSQSLLLAMRPHQWLKNVLIFLPLLAAHKFESSTILDSLLAFISFSLLASSVYILNDLLDINTDRAHPRKRLRPFASGSLSIKFGGFLTFVFFISGTVIATYLGWMFMFVLCLYYILTTVYSLILKRKIIMDICILAGLYTIRIISGGLATGIELSVWLLNFSMFFFLSLAAVKRQAELVDMKDRKVLKAKGRGYHIKDLPIISMVGLGAGYVSVLVLAIYINSPDVQELYNFPYALWGICCILLYWLTRMIMITHRGLMHDDPIIFAVKDKISHLCLFLILGFGFSGALM